MVWTCLFKTSQLLLLQKLFSPYFWGGLPYLDSFIIKPYLFPSLYPLLWQSNNMYIPAPPAPPPDKPISAPLLCFLLPISSLPPTLFVSLFQLLSLDVGVLTVPLQYSKHSCKYFICTINFILSFNPPSNFMR